MSISRFIANRAQGMMKGRFNSESLRRARRAALQMRIRNNHLGLKETMRQAGVTSFMAYWVVDGNVVKLHTEPSLEVPGLLEDAQMLINMGFLLVKAEVTADSIRFVELEFQDEKVKAYLDSNQGLVSALGLARRIEDEGIKR